jgi:hypothetical protein
VISILVFTVLACAVLAFSAWANQLEVRWRTEERRWRAHAFLWGLAGMHPEALRANVYAQGARRKAEECSVFAVPYRLAKRFFTESEE